MIINIRRIFATILLCQALAYIMLKSVIWISSPDEEANYSKYFGNTTITERYKTLYFSNIIIIISNYSKFAIRKDKNYFTFENNSLVRLWIEVPNSFPWRKCLHTYKSQLHTYPCQKYSEAESQIYTVITLPGDQTRFSLYHKELEIA